MKGLHFSWLKADVLWLAKGRKKIREGVELIHEQQATPNKKLVSKLLNKDPNLVSQWMKIYDDMVRNGSVIPLHTTWIRFRELYFENPYTGVWHSQPEGVAEGIVEGGPGSGFRGHAGRPGEVGGSSGEVGGAPEGKTFIGNKPKTKFQKQYARVAEYEGRKIHQFSGKYKEGIAAGRAVEIPKQVRISKGEEATSENLQKIFGAYKAGKSELGYIHVQDLVDLSGLDKEYVHKSLIFLVKAGNATLNVDRWGNAVFVKLKEKIREGVEMSTLQEIQKKLRARIRELLPKKEEQVKEERKGSGNWGHGGRPGKRGGSRRKE